MMKFNIKTILVVAVVFTVALVSWFMMSGLDKASSSKATKSSVRRVVVSKKNTKVKRITEISLERKNGRNAVRIVESEKIKPQLDDDLDDDEEKLTDLQKSIIKELQTALDNEDIKAVRKALSKFTANAGSGGLGGRVPKMMRMKAVEALGWFGKDAAIDLLGYMADGDDEVSSEAFDQFDFALQDSDMGDIERAEILKAAMKAITDSERIESLLFALDDMRNSCKYETIKDIFKNGTEQAKAVMREQLDFYTDDDVTPETLDEWAEMNPDDEDDTEFYNSSEPSKD